MKSLDSLNNSLPFSRLFLKKFRFWAILPLFFIVCGINSLWSQTETAPLTNGPSAAELESLHALIKTFFENISDTASGSSRKGLELLLKNSPLDNENKETLLNALAEKIKSIHDQFGPYVSFEPIGVKGLGRDLVILRYLYKCQNYPVVWYFIFYRPLSASGDSGNKTWFLIHFYYDSQLNVPLWESDF